MNAWLDDTRLRWGAAGLALLILIALLAWLLRDGDEDAQDLLALLRAAETTYSYPGLTPDAAAQTLTTPDAMTDFVRDGVMLQDYRGRMLDAEDVLLQRGANAMDKAGLLAALLEAAGLPTRLRTADWPDAAPALGAPQADRSESLSALYAFLDIDEEADRLARAETDIATMQTLASELAAAQALLAQTWDAQASAAPLVRQDWVWVEFDRGQGWEIADPVFPDLPRPTGATELVLDAPAPVMVQLDLVSPRGARTRLLDAPARPGDESVIRFVPSAGFGAFLRASPGESQVETWLPVLSSGSDVASGQAFTRDGFLLPHEDGAPPDIGAAPGPPPTISQAEILDVDVSDFPRVTLTVRTDAPADARWNAAHLDLREAGTPQRPRILRQPEAERSVAFVTDVSASMIQNGRIFRAGLLGRGVIEQMAYNRSISVTSSAGEAISHDRMNIIVTTQNGVQTFNESLDIRPGSGALPDALAIGISTFWQPGDVLLFTDGEDSDPAALSAAIERFGGRVIAIVPDGQAARFETIADAVWSLPAEADIPATAAALYEALGAPLQVSFLAAPGEAGETRAIELAFPDSDLRLETAYQLPETTRPTDARIEISLSHNGAPLGEARTLLALNAGVDEAGLMAQHSLLVSSGRFAPDALLRRMIEELRIELETTLADNPQPGPPLRGASYLALNTAGNLVGRMDRLLGARVERDSPMVILRSAAIDLSDPETAYGVSTLDILHDGHARLDGMISPLTGLALASLEGAMVGAPSVNSALTAGDAVLIDPRTPIPDAWSPAVSRVLAEPGSTLIATQDGAQAWLITADGHLTARLFPTGHKGARAQQAIREFKQIRTNAERIAAVASGIGSPYGVSGAQLGAIAGILDTNLRLWCYATVMLGFMNDELATGVREDNWEGQAAAGCEIDPNNALGYYLGGAAAGYYSGWLGDKMTNAANGLSGGLPPLVESGVNTGAGALINWMGGGGSIRDGVVSVMGGLR